MKVKWRLGAVPHAYELRQTQDGMMSNIGLLNFQASWDDTQWSDILERKSSLKLFLHISFLNVPKINRKNMFLKRVTLNRQFIGAIGNSQI